MKKLINGIVDFRRNVRASYREAFGKLATGQSPDALFVACSDSRVVPNTFASTNPGDLFVIRNVGNLIPACHPGSASNPSETVAVEFAVLSLNVSYIIVCGHSECAAMSALVGNNKSQETPSFRSWLQHGTSALKAFKEGKTLDPTLSKHNQLSQLNVLHQLQNLMSYPAVQKRVEDGTLTLHGWWFDIAKADVYAYEEEMGRFVLIDEEEAARMLARIRQVPS